MTTQMTIVGNLTDDPRVRFTDSGTVTSFRVAHTERRRSPETEQWEDGKKLFVNVSCWRDITNCRIASGNPRRRRYCPTCSSGRQGAIQDVG